MGQDVIMAPNVPTYFNYSNADSPNEPVARRGCNTLDMVAGFEPVPPELDDEARARVIGTQCQLWTEHMPTVREVEYMAFPRISAFAEAAWTPAERRDSADLLRRVDALSGAKTRSLRAGTVSRRGCCLHPGRFF